MMVVKTLFSGSKFAVFYTGTLTLRGEHMLPDTAVILGVCKSSGKMGHF